jgi:hypothetical protein
MNLIRVGEKMSKSLRTILNIIVIIALAAGVLFIGSRIMRMFAGGSGFNAGIASAGLVAVSADGKSIPADPATQLPKNTAVQKVGNLNVALALTPYPPVGWQDGSFDVTLTDAQGQAITDAKITLDLTMPAMPMPPNSFEAQPSGSGLYHATGMLTMRGLWKIEVIIERGGQKQSVFFEVGL